MSSPKRSAYISILVALVAFIGLLSWVIYSSLGHFSSEEVPQDDSPLTMNIDRTVIPEYYLGLQKQLEERGIKLVIESNITSNSSGNNTNRLAHDDMPDIITMWAPFPPKLQREKLLDLTQFSFIDAFRQRRLNAISLDGAVYQLPYSSKLIGIQYNKTMFQENGWEPPRNFAEFQALVPKIREAGYHVSTTAMPLTGHGFNYLFHFAGVTALYTPKGAEWLEQYLHGVTTDVWPIEKTLAYLEKLKECGFFENARSGDGEKIFKTHRRSAFYLDIVSHCESYSGPLYGSNDRPIPEKFEISGDGEYVCVGGEYVAYDKSNPGHSGLTRYRCVDYRRISDEYAIMPWFNELGDNNCFCIYDNFYVSLNRRLAEPQNQKKLRNALTVLEYLCQDELVQFCQSESKDVYIPMNNFRMDEKRCYAKYADMIQLGYLMPWYYPSFDNSVIVRVGEKMNRWLSDARKEDGSAYSSDDVLTELRDAQATYLSQGTAMEEFGTVVDNFDVNETARFLAYCMAWGLQRHLDAQSSLGEAPAPKEVAGALMPYRVSRDWQIGIGGGVCCSRLYQGPCDRIVLSAIMPQFAVVDGMVLTGGELRKLRESGFSHLVSPSVSYTFPYAFVLRDGVELKDDGEYLVAVMQSQLSDILFSDKVKAGQYFRYRLPMPGCMQEAVRALKRLTPEQFREERQNF